MPTPLQNQASELSAALRTAVEKLENFAHVERQMKALMPFLIDKDFDDAGTLSGFITDDIVGEITFATTEDNAEVHLPYVARDIAKVLEKHKMLKGNFAIFGKVTYK